MRILVGRHSGFCFGVQRAVSLAKRYADAGLPAWTYGAIIHNERVVEALAEQGVRPVERVDALQEGDTLILRAHGVPPQEEAACRARGVTVVDATCPFVKRIHRLVADTNGRAIFVAGQAHHPEVAGILGYAGAGARVLESVADAERVTPMRQAVIVAQTTMARAEYAAIVAALRERIAELEVHDTICDTTRQRQREAEQIAARCTKMFVIGSHSSANTGRLAEIAKKFCKQTKTIENIDKLLLDNLQSDDIIGVVAGASTPDWMIREVIQLMSELEKTTIETIEAEAPAAEIAVTEEPAVAEEVVAAEEPAVETAAEETTQSAETADETSDFAEAFEKTLTRIRNGQIITGTVLQIVDGEVYVNVGYKSDGIIPKNEFSNDADADPSELLNVGDSIEVEVLKVNDGEGNVLLSRKNVESKKLWDEMMAEAENSDKVFDAVGKEVVKGGIIADIDGIRAFVPASQVSTKYIENLSEYVGKPMRLKVLETDKQRKRIVASQKQVLLAEAAANRRAKWESLVVGSKVKGVVRRITDFGAFVDIGGIDGLVHVTDAAWGRVKHPSDVLSIGQEIEVLILNVDVEKERVSLGYKQLQPKPWTLADQKYPVGSIVEGKVVRIVPFGAFVALESTIDGLIHISQVGVRRIAKVEDEIKVGDIVRCKVLEVNTEAKRISLSRREAILEEQPEVAEQLQAERAERDRQYQERQEQRQREREQQPQRRERTERPAAQSDSGERRDRNDRRRRSSEDGDYELPPVQSTTTSLADLFQAFKTEE
ncbi:MAG: bifunctional 4-hydroxy-3-methylbut-2-enyl diphosphate reductase/30S ribosomal protein S1 [bacterium]|nr:bifunctional 4-hydroxy-3-methylbut-2-enyl diphosphate reductase/30S ribosomal protein S1 [bacterium]